MELYTVRNLIGMSVFFLCIIIIGVVVIKFVPGPPTQTWRYSPPKIMHVSYLGSVYKPRKGAKRRFFLNSLFLGITEGVLFGALEGEELWHRFRVRYDTGTVKILECLDGSKQYYDLMSKVE